MNIDLLSTVQQINYRPISSLLPSFLAKLHKTLQTLVIENYEDIFDGFRRYLSINQTLTNDALINQVIGMLLVIYLNNMGLDKNLLLSELNRISENADEQIVKSIKATEYFINNYFDIVSVEDKELYTHRSKLILMERVGKFIQNAETRDKVVDFMLLMGN